MGLFLFAVGMTFVLFPFAWHCSRELRDNLAYGIVAFVGLTIKYWKEFFNDVFGEASDEE